MATKSRKFSHSIFVKVVIFLFMMASVTCAIYSVLHIIKDTKGNIEIIFEKNYIESSAFSYENDGLLRDLAYLINVYKNEEYILEGNSIDADEYDWDKGIVENDKDVSQKDEANSEINEAKKAIIAEDLENFQMILKNLEKVEEPFYYVTDGENTYTNGKQTTAEQFRQYPVYYIFDGHETEVSPNEINLDSSYYYYGYNRITDLMTSEDTKMYIGYTDKYIASVSQEWVEAKESVMSLVYFLITCIVVFFASVFYFILTAGRRSFTDTKVYMLWMDKLFVDINLVLMFIVCVSWFALMDEAQHQTYLVILNGVVYVGSILAGTILMILGLSVVRHMKNGTFFKHMLLTIVVHGLYRFVKDLYDSGTVGMKVAIVVVVYPIIAAISLIFFPITIGAAVWLTLKQVKSFNKIQDGAKMIREGNLQHYIDVDGDGEFAKLAASINGINDGLKQAVHNELKNERMKTELITNVSHDIRTPLTSFITYTDLLKDETDPEKIKEYIEILEQKSKRLKVLTDDLFAAAKASSGDIPVDLQQIDVVALINQGIGEVSEQISMKNLSFKCHYPADNMYVIADGKLLWRSIENILSNIFNYALEGSRVYIDITEEKDGILISFKNISKDELNITEEELMERFKRGDDSRSSQGSGLGLAITKSLIENQHGTFEINIDGDLFKSMIYLPAPNDEKGKMG